MLIRAATASDASAVATIHHLGWTESYRGLLPDAYLDALCYDACLARWSSGFGGAASVAVAIAGVEVVGFVSFGPCADPDAPAAGEVWDLWVAARHRGAGVGRDLLRHGLAALSRDHRAAVVWVLEANAAARRFYQREGAVRDGMRRTSSVPGGELRDVRYLFDLRGSASPAE